MANSRGSSITAQFVARLLWTTALTISFLTMSILFFQHQEQIQHSKAFRWTQQMLFLWQNKPVEDMQSSSQDHVKQEPGAQTIFGDKRNHNEDETKVQMLDNKLSQSQPLVIPSNQQQQQHSDDQCYFLDDEKYDPYSEACIRDNLPPIPDHLLPKKVLEKREANKKATEDARDAKDASVTRHKNNTVNANQTATAATDGSDQERPKIIERKELPRLYRWTGAPKVHYDMNGQICQIPNEEQLAEMERLKNSAGNENREDAPPPLADTESIMAYNNKYKSIHGMEFCDPRVYSEHVNKEPAPAPLLYDAYQPGIGYMPSVTFMPAVPPELLKNYNDTVASKVESNFDSKGKENRQPQTEATWEPAISDDEGEKSRRKLTSRQKNPDPKEDQHVPFADSTVKVAALTSEPSEEPSTVPSLSPTKPPENRPTVLPATVSLTTLSTNRVDPALQPQKPTLVSQESLAAASDEETAPSALPTESPSRSSRFEPTILPTAGPSGLPTERHTASPTARQTFLPTESPSRFQETPTALPTESPSRAQETPTALPTESPSRAQETPIALPTESPSRAQKTPTALSTESPSRAQETPTALPTETGSLSLPTEGTTWLPTEYPTLAPSANTCPVSVCDFSFLDVGVPLSQVDQGDAVENACNLAVTGSKKDGTGFLSVNVFNSSNPTGGNWELGSPHASCGGNPLVDGSGGKKNGPYPNCQSQGNLLIVQEEGVDAKVPQSSAIGGCILVDFVDPVDIANIGILNVKQGERVVILVENGDGEREYIGSPDNMSENSLWLVNLTNPSVKQHQTLKIEVCFPSAGALSFLSYYDDCSPSSAPTAWPTTEATGAPIPAPTLLPTDGPTSLPTERPTVLPVEASRRHLDWVRPTASPTDLDRRFLDGAMDYIHCDFSALEPGLYLSDIGQSDRLEQLCSMSVSGTAESGMGTLPVKVLDTSGVDAGDVTLGSPHSSCGGREDVNGAGGHADGPFPNCEPQGNVLLLGGLGCINLDFSDPIKLVGMGLLLGSGDEHVKISIMDGEGEAVVFTSPERAGPNALWMVNKTDPAMARKGVILVTICSSSPVGFSFVDYFIEKKDEPKKYVADEEYTEDNNLSWCGQHLSGFYFVDASLDYNSSEPNLLTDGQVVRMEELRDDNVIVPAVDEFVGAIRFYLPSGEIMAFPPFRLSSTWLQNTTTGKVQVRADAFSTKTEKYLGSCEVTIELDQSKNLTCGPGVHGFFFVDPSGKMVDKIGNLRSAQMIHQRDLPVGADIAVSYDNRAVAAIKFEAPGFYDKYVVHEPFRMNFNKFERPGKYRVVAYAYYDKDFSSVLNSCEISFQVLPEAEEDKAASAATASGRVSYSSNISYPFESISGRVVSRNGGRGTFSADIDISDFEFLPDEALIGSDESNRAQHLRALKAETDEEADPIMLPTMDASHPPTTASPTVEDHRFLKNALKYVHCDFSTLQAGVYLSDVNQSDRLESTCGVQVFGARKDSTGTRDITVYDSANVTDSRWDLGSPHSSCGGEKEVNGVGGHIDGPFPNCEGQGNLLVFAAGTHDPDSDDCMNFDFYDPINLVGIGILNVSTSNPVKVTTMDGEGETVVITSPGSTGPNSLWLVNQTNPGIKKKGVVLIKICLSGSSGITFLDYFVETHNKGDTMAEGREGERSYPLCNSHLSGFFLADSSKDPLTAISGFGSLKNGQVIRLDKLPENFVIFPTVDDIVEAIKYYLPSEELTFYPFQIEGRWLRESNQTGEVRIRADSFSAEKAIVGSCEVVLVVEQILDSAKSNIDRNVVAPGDLYPTNDISLSAEDNFNADDFLPKEPEYWSPRVKDGRELIEHPWASVMDQQLEQRLSTVRSLPEESDYALCGHHLSGFFFVDASKESVTVIPGYALLSGQVIHPGEIPQDFAIVPVIDHLVDAIRYYLPPGEVVLFHPFRVEGRWLLEMTGPVKIRADAFSTKEERFLGSCEVVVTIDGPQNGTRAVTSTMQFDKVAVPSLPYPFKKTSLAGLFDDPGHQKVKGNIDMGASMSSAPTMAQSTSAPHPPTVSPTSPPTDMDRRFLPSLTSYIHCDFSSLEAGILLSDVEQSTNLENACGLTISATARDSKGTRQIDVFDTANVTDQNWDLGSPHSSCGGRVEVNGTGGHVKGQFANCEDQGNVLVLTNESGSGGGCIQLDFVDPVKLVGMGILNVGAGDPVKVTIMDVEGESVVITSPGNAGPNSLWLVNQTHPEMKKTGAILATVCFTASAGLSFIDYFFEARREEGNGTAEEQTGGEGPETRCGHHITGFFYVDISRGSDQSDARYELLSGQVVQLDDLPENFIIAPTVDHRVEAVRYYLGADEVMTFPPFQIRGEWLTQVDGDVRIRADAFSIKGEEFLGSCEITIVVDRSGSISEPGNRTARIDTDNIRKVQYSFKQISGSYNRQDDNGEGRSGLEDDDYLPEILLGDHFEPAPDKRQLQLLKSFEQNEQLHTTVPQKDAFPPEENREGLLPGPSVAPTPSLTESDLGLLDYSAKRVHCDFSLLEKGVLLSEARQSRNLENVCFFSVSGTLKDGSGTREVNVFDTSNVSEGSWNLGSPHSSCGGQTGVDGLGGYVHGSFPNCEAQGKVLVLESTGGGDEHSGCLYIHFVDPVKVKLEGMGLLDVDVDQPAKITITDEEGESIVITSPEVFGPNALWLVHKTHPGMKKKGVILVTVCFPTSSGGFSFIDYFIADHSSKVDYPEYHGRDGTPGQESSEDEDGFPWCGRHLRGFSFVGKTFNDTLRGYAPLVDQLIRPFELPPDLALEPAVYSKVTAVRYYLPTTEVTISSSPFRLDMDWLRDTYGSVRIRADAFSGGMGDSKSEEQLVGSCDVLLDVDPSQSLSCGPDVVGFFFVDRSKATMKAFKNLRTGQVIRGHRLPYGTDLGIAYKNSMTVGAVKFESAIRDFYASDIPFLMNWKRFHLPGNYTVKAYAYSDAEFSHLLNTCKINIRIV